MANQNFAYDWQGNLTSLTDTSNYVFDRSLGTVSYSATRPNQMTAATGMTVAHDASGNMVDLRVARATGTCSMGTLSRCAQQYRYDFDEIGQLARARRWDYSRTIPAGNAAWPSLPAGAPTMDLKYAYSAGQRVLKESADAQGPLYTAEVFDTLRLNATRFVSGDYRRDETTETPYLAGIARVNVSTALPSPSGNPRHVFLNLGDHLGSTSVLIDRETSEVVEKATYMAYGAIESDYRPARWSQLREDYKFTGKEEDFEVGLTYFGARYYHARLGRFISADPLTIHMAQGDLNPFAYVGGKVFTHTDPWGLTEQAVTGPQLPTTMAAEQSAGGVPTGLPPVPPAEGPAASSAGGMANSTTPSTSSWDGLVEGLQTAADIAGKAHAAEALFRAVGAAGGAWLGGSVALRGSMMVAPTTGNPVTAGGVVVVAVGAGVTAGGLAGSEALAPAGKNVDQKLRNWASKGGGGAKDAPTGPTPKAGQAGGEGERKSFPQRVKAQARAESENRCVFCNKSTTSEQGPNRSEIDHAIPKSRGGNNTIDNAQNTCRTCNRQKGAQTTEEFQERRGP